MRTVRRSTNVWFVRAHTYLERARKIGLPAAEKYAAQFRNQEKLERAIKLISDGAASPRA